VNVPDTSIGTLAGSAVLTSTEELYNAIDMYLQGNDPTSEVVKRFGKPMGAWDVSAISNFSYAFDVQRNPAVRTFNEDLWWNTSQATSLRAMFRGADLFNGNISLFDTSLVADMSELFRGALTFDGDLSGWNTSSVLSMQQMFENAISFSGDISSWDVSKVVDMSEMFQYASSYNGEMQDWQTKSVTSMKYMFRGCSQFNRDISVWSVENVLSFVGMVSVAFCYGVHRLELSQSQRFLLFLGFLIVSSPARSLLTKIFVRGDNSWHFHKNFFLVVCLFRLLVTIRMIPVL
jgi:surface protein